MKKYKIINFRQQLSPYYWAYSLLSKISITSFGRFILDKTRKYCENNSRMIIKKSWWIFHLLNFAYNYDLDKAVSECNKKIDITRVHEFDYAFWNGCFHGDALSRIVYELDKGNFPVSVSDKFGVWNCFFDNPIKIEYSENLEQVCETDVYPYYHPKFVPYNKIATKVGCKIYQDFVHLNDQSREYITKECEQIFSKTDNILGVICRGTDYVNEKPKDHPRQPDLSVIIKKVEKYMKKYNYEYIYLATESEEIHNRFNESFPGKILINKRSYYDSLMDKNGIVYIEDVHFDRENDDYYKGIEYLSSLYILANCKSLIGGNCTGTRIALYINNLKYDHVVVFDRGLY